MSNAVDTLLTILDLERLEDNLYRGLSPQVGWQRVFGGQVVGQALVAATRTVEGRAPHSLHGYFMLGGDPSVPIIYQVDRIRDGRSFATRRVVALQHGAAIFSMSASFHAEEPGFDHQMPMPEAPAPEDLPGEAEFMAKFMDHAPENVRRYFERRRPIELRPVDASRWASAGRPTGEDGPLTQQVWFRATGPLPDDTAIHQCVLTYASDMTLLETSMLAHGHSAFDPAIQAASLDHALWFHRPFRADEWLLYTQDTPSATSARGFNRGMIFNRAGDLVASVAQEGLMRIKK